MIKNSDVVKTKNFRGEEVEASRNKYVCDWCKFEFEQTVRTVNKVSSQVVCPRCKNFIKTWW